MIIHVLGSYEYNISGYTWRQCICRFAWEIQIPPMMLLASIFNCGCMHVCFSKGCGSVGACHMDTQVGVSGKGWGVVWIMCPRAPSSYSSSSLVIFLMQWGHMLSCPPLSQVVPLLVLTQWSLPPLPRPCLWLEGTAVYTNKAIVVVKKLVSKTDTWTPQGPGTCKQCLNENACHYSN